MTADPFPDLWSHLEISALPSRKWVECADCIENKSIDDGATDPQEWAVRHTQLLPWHTRFRIVSQVGFSVEPTAAPEPVTL